MGSKVASTVLPMPHGDDSDLIEYAQQVKLVLETAFAEIGGAGAGLLAGNNLSDVTSAATARTNLAVLGIANNLSDVASAATSRTNLAVLAIANNLSDVASAATSRSNLGIPHAVAQTVSTVTGAVATGTTNLPFDDTIPQITEGDQYMSLAITPTNASSTLHIFVTLFGAISGNSFMSAALFQDATANALAAGAAANFANNNILCIPFKHSMTAGTTSATTFKVRAGANAGVTTMTFNGQSSARLFGGVIASSITIIEVLP